MKYIYTILFFLSLSLNSSYAQWELVRSATPAELSATTGGLLAVPYGADSYKITYETTNIDGTPGIASGLITIPQDANLNFPMAVYQHGTVGSRTDVPSELAGGYQLGELLSGFGYIVLQPDFLGLGVNQGIHPYVHADSEAWVAVDMMRAVKANLNEELDGGPFLNDQVFISGYSQGGHAAMALHRSLELDHSDEFTVTAAAPMSGPYSISEKMIDFTLGDEEYFFCAYLASTMLSTKAAFPVLTADYEIEDIFKPQYLPGIMAFQFEEIDLFALNADMNVKLIEDVGAVIPKEMIYPEIVEAVKNDPTHPLSQALAMNDVFDWAPKAPTRLYYCTADDQVTFENAILASEVMKANGAADVIAIERGETLDHGGCVSPAAIAAVFFFNGLMDVSTAIEKIETIDLGLRLQQSYGSLLTEINPEFADSGNLNLVIMDMASRSILSHSISQSSFELNISNLAQGMYFVTVMDEGNPIAIQKLFVK